MQNASVKVAKDSAQKVKIRMGMIKQIPEKSQSS